MLGYGPEFAVIRTCDKPMPHVFGLVDTFCPAFARREWCQPVDDAAMVMELPFTQRLPLPPGTTSRSVSCNGESSFDKATIAFEDWASDTDIEML